MSNGGSIGPTQMVLALFSVLVSVPTLAADRFVSTSGNDAANDCLNGAAACRTIGHAFTQAASGDTIKLAEGTYAESLLTVSGNTTLTISGGWSADFGSQNTSPARTKIDARYQATALVVTAAGTTIDLTLDTVTITKGIQGINASSSGAGSLTLTIVDSLLRSNRDDPFYSYISYAGGIALHSSGTSVLSASVTNTTFKSNRGDYGGGGIAAESSGPSTLSLAITGSTFVSNRSRVAMVALGAHQLDSSTMTVNIEDSAFNANRGGAIGVHDGALSVTNSVFTSNKFGAIQVFGFSAGSVGMSVVNSTFRRNEGGAIYVQAVDSAELRNNLLWGNKSNGTPRDVTLVDSTVDVDHCDIGAIEGSYNDLGGNLSVDPLLTGDGHLRAGSPVIDAGTCTGAPATDFEADARPAGAGCDMGADEFVP